MEDIEILKAQLGDSSDPLIRAKLLLEIAVTAWKKSAYSEGKTYAEAALELSMSLGEESIQAEAIHLIGTFYAYLDDYDAALEYYLRAQRLNNQLGNKLWEAEAYNSMGDIFIKLSNIPKATECFEQSHALHPEYERCVNNLGFMRMLKGDLDEAISYYQQAMSIAQANNNIRSTVISHINISDIYCKQGNAEAALQELDQAAALLSSSSIETPLELAVALQLNRAVATKLHGDTKLAMELLQQARAQAEKGNLQHYHLQSMALLAEMYAEREEWKSAFEAQATYSQLYSQIIGSSTVQKANSIQSFYARENRNLISMNLTERSSRLATLGILSSGITHELNQPLSAIKISTESILYWLKREEITLPMNFNEELAHVMEGVKRIEAFLRQIRQFWNSGKTAEITLCQPEEIIEQALSLLSRRMFALGVELLVQKADPLPALKVAPIHLQQIIINLLAYCMGILESCPRKHKVLKLNADRHDSKLRIIILQNGTEITRDMMNQLYNPLSPDTQNAASEMGMAIVKYLCDHYGYRITTTSDGDFWGFRLLMGEAT